jgi:lysozyme family protein
MAIIDFNRRMLLQLGISASAGIFFGAPAAGQSRKLFGIKLPKELDAVLPPKALGIAETVDAILTLESDADLKKLPSSILSSNSGRPISADDESLYELALPRLVALIDRSELRDTGIADKAGELLAQLHSTQWTVPAALIGFDAGRPGLGGAGDRLSIDTQSAQSGNLSLDLPEGGEIAPTAPQPQPSVDAPPPQQPAPEPPPAQSTEPPTAENQTKPEVSQDAQPAADGPLSRRRDYASLSQEYTRLFASATIRAKHSQIADWHLTMLRNSRARYEQVSNQTSVPWYFIGIIHGLEASFNFRAHLHNGDFPLNRRTRQVPSGRPRVWLPPIDWPSSAKDALNLLGFTGQSDWSLPKTLYRLEAYNGLGYRPYGIPSPYLWSFSNHYSRGKFISDGKWSATARSKQCGAAVMLKLLQNAGEISIA